MSRTKLVAALSQEAMGVTVEGTSREIEYVWFLKLANFEQLKAAAHTEIQLQHEYFMRNEPGGKPTGVIRSRSINEGEKFEFTVKNFDESKMGALETTIAGTADLHKAIESISERGFRKIRYSFPFTVPHEGKDIELVWEIDVFVLPSGENHPWVKVDLEVPSETMQPPVLPFQYDEVIDRRNELTPEQRTFIDSIFAEVEVVKK